VLQQQIEYSTGLHAERLKSYQALFSILKPLALDGRAQPGREECRRLASQITDWYYDIGGVHTSAELRDDIFELRHRLFTYPDDGYNAGSEMVRADMRSSFAAVEGRFPLCAYASLLRTRISAEVLSRAVAPKAASTDEESGDD
jgi:hypothetical protein